MRLSVHVVLAALAIGASVVLARAMVPRTIMSEVDPVVSYAESVPESFGEWTINPAIRVVVPEEPDALANRVYSQMIGRGYVDRNGNMVMLLIAYGPRQSDRLQLHRPEVCYVAEGFSVASLRSATLSLMPGAAPFDIRRMTAQREGRVERITYWMRIGDDIVSDLLHWQAAKFGYGLRGIIPDGVLIRVSSISADEAAAHALHDRFLRDLFGAIAARDHRFYLGAKALTGRETKGAALAPAR